MFEKKTVYKIYRIVSDNTEKVYIGCTKSKLYLRLNNHKGHFKCYTEGKMKNFCSSFDVISYGCCRIEKIQEVENKDEALEIEKQNIQLLGDRCVNKHKLKYTLANRELNKEYMKQYYAKHKEKMIEQCKKAYERRKNKKD